ncbi:hypothetical protein [Streptomyces sp. AcH 505]|uniref:hypothetical protein n=1 Tax=Streptomyces sp. AcH 505 TaxID=352211 RepID=UPI0005A79D85
MTQQAMPRRAMLMRLAGIGAGAALVSASGGLLVPAAAAENEGQRTQEPRKHPATPNGWLVADSANTDQGVWSRPVSGAGFTVATRLGMVETVLVHVVRRWHYEIETLRAGEVVGWRPLTGLDAGHPEANQASGTAVTIRPGSYVKGARGGLTQPQRSVVRDILDDCGGLVRWGGDDDVPYEALFYIDIPPNAAARSGGGALVKLADKVRGWNQTPGLGAGVKA